MTAALVLAAHVAALAGLPAARPEGAAPTLPQAVVVLAMPSLAAAQAAPAAERLVARERTIEAGTTGMTGMTSDRVAPASTRPMWTPTPTPTPTPTLPRPPVAAALPGDAPIVSAEPGPAPIDVVPGAEGRYRVAARLDMPPMPISAPDLERLTGYDYTGEPIRLRLYIEDDGRVSRAEVLADGGCRPEVLAAVQAVFIDTRFVPGRLQGHDVPSYKDIEFRIDTLG